MDYFDWKIRYINGIMENGIECWWCIGSFEKNGLRRFYKIVPFYKQDESGVVISKEYNYFVLFESCRFTEVANVLTDSSNCYGGNIYIDDEPIIVGIYDSLESAQKRAQAQLGHIFNLINAYFPKDEEKKCETRV